MNKALCKKSIPQSEIDEILQESSDDEVDNVECEDVYDSDIDADYAD